MPRARFHIAYRHGSHRVYACDIYRNDPVRDKYGFHYQSVRVASLPMNADARVDNPTPSYVIKLKQWYERRDNEHQSSSTHLWNAAVADG
jgi:hypothetical protein